MSGFKAKIKSITSELNISDLSLDQFISYLASNSPTHGVLIVTPNIDHYQRIAQLPRLKTIYQSAEFCFNDSKLLQLLHRLVRLRMPCVTGSDLTARFFASDGVGARSIGIVGMDPSDREKLEEKYSFAVTFHKNPSMGFINNPHEVDALVDEIVLSSAKYLFLAVGSPQQEMLAQRILEHPTYKGYIFCIGASLEFLIQKKTKAPKAFTWGIEWFWRLITEPRRLGPRYWRNAKWLIRHIALN